MSKKISSILILQIILQLLFSCCRSVQYYDYSQMEVITPDEQISITEELLIELKPLDLRFIGYKTGQFGFSFSMAINCDEGWNGMKFPITSIEVISNANFDSIHQAGDSMNDYFLFKRFLSSDQFEYISIEDLLTDAPEGVNVDHVDLILQKRPNLARTHQFTITLTKSNGTTISLETNPISWE
ncbi:MAG: hypothetical protein AAFO07_11600 [Bacteroidota bacterium]